MTRASTEREQAAKAALAAYQAELAGRFATRRCRCGTEAVACVVVGRDAHTEMDIVLRHAVPDQNLCLHCAGMVTQEQEQSA